jgi:hypothetical protein
LTCLKVIVFALGAILEVTSIFRIFSVPWIPWIPWRHQKTPSGGDSVHWRQWMKDKTQIKMLSKQGAYRGLMNPNESL